MEANTDTNAMPKQQLEQIKEEPVQQQETSQEEKPQQQKSMSTFEHLCMCGGDIGGVVKENMKSAAMLMSRGAATVSTATEEACAQVQAAPPVAETSPEEAPEKKLTTLSLVPEVAEEESAGSEGVAKKENAEEPKENAVVPPAASVTVAVAGDDKALTKNETDIKTELADKEEELLLANKRIESLTGTKAYLLDTISNSARKLIPAAIAAKDGTIADLREKVAAEQRATAAANETAASKTAEVELLQKEKVEAAELLQLAVKAVEEKWTATLAEKDAVVATKDTAMAEKEKAIADGNDAVAAKEAEIAARDALIAERDATITSKDEAIASAARCAEETSAAHAAELKEKDEEIARRDAASEADRTRILSLERAVADARRKLEEATRCPVRHLETYLELKEERIRALEKRLDVQEGGFVGDVVSEDAPAAAANVADVAEKEEAAAALQSAEKEVDVAKVEQKIIIEQIETEAVDDARDDMEESTTEAVAISAE